VSFSGDLVSTDESKATEARPSDTGHEAETGVETRSFLVRIWREAETRPGKYIWRGHVTEVTEAKRKYVKSLDEIGLFIAGYLPELGSKPSWRWRSKLWLQELKKRFRMAK